MKSHHKLFLELMTLIEQYENEVKEKGITLEDFILWLNRSVLLKSLPPVVYHDDDNNNIRVHLDSPGSDNPDYLAKRANVQLTILLHQLSKHFKIYSKKILADSDLVSIDGHMFLSTLYHIDGMTKARLISSNYMELPSGIEVIRRLLKKGFIEEFDEPKDKRSKQVKISKRGKKEYEDSLPAFRKAIDILAGNLSDDKIISLNILLDELNNFHKQIHSKAKKESLDELLHYLKEMNE